MKIVRRRKSRFCIPDSCTNALPLQRDVQKEHHVGEEEESQGGEIERERPLQGIDAASIEPSPAFLTDRLLTEGERPVPVQLITAFASDKGFHGAPC